MSRPGSGSTLGSASRNRVLLAAAVLALAVACAFSNALRSPFVFDDLTAIPENPSIRSMWPVWATLRPPPQATTVGGRPLANLTLALNYAVSGTDPWSYHALNILIHALAGLALLGLVRRTLLLAPLRERFGRDALALGLATALLWALHPLQTESVTYVVQRVESLAGLFYLVTLYCALRGAGAGGGLWNAAAVAACLAGVCTKEVVATAPLVVLLYDRTFLSASFREALGKRRGLYAGLAATWLPLAGLVATTGFSRGGSAGFGSAPALAYWLTQFEAVSRYLRLSVFPSPLVFDYGTHLLRGAGAALPFALPVIALAAAVAFALRALPRVGFLGAWFFVILAPSGLVPVATQTMAEHRMYLPLAAIVVGLVLGAYRLAGRWSWVLVAACILVSFMLTRSRNADYASTLSLWGDTAQKEPGNARAHNNLGLALFRLGRDAEAISHYRTSIAIEPGDQGTHSNLGNALDRLGRTDEAIAQYESALRIQPDFAPALFNLAKALYRQGRTEEAIARYLEVIRVQPDYAEAYSGLGDALEGLSGRGPEAIARYEQAIRLKPDLTAAHYGLAVALSAQGRSPEAIAEYEQALAMRPDFAEASTNLGVLLCASGQVSEGTRRIEAALQINPDYAKAHYDLGNVLAQSGRIPEAVGHYQEALRIDPNMAEVNNNLGMILCRSGHIPEGLAHIEAAIRAKPDFAPAHFIRGLALLQSGRRAEASQEFELVLKLRPNDPSAEKMLEMIRSAP